MPTVLGLPAAAPSCETQGCAPHSAAFQPTSPTIPDLSLVPLLLRPAWWSSLWVTLCSWGILSLPFPLQRALPFLRLHLAVPAQASQASSPGLSHKLHGCLSSPAAPRHLKLSKCKPKPCLPSHPHTGRLPPPISPPLQR